MGFWESKVFIVFTFLFISSAFTAQAFAPNSKSGKSILSPVELEIIENVPAKEMPGIYFNRRLKIQSRQIGTRPRTFSYEIPAKKAGKLISVSKDGSRIAVSFSKSCNKASCSFKFKRYDACSKEDIKGQFYEGLTYSSQCIRYRLSQAPAGKRSKVLGFQVSCAKSEPNCGVLSLKDVLYLQVNEAQIEKLNAKYGIILANPCEG